MNSTKNRVCFEIDFFFEFELDFYCLCSLQKSISKWNWFFDFLNLIFPNWKKIKWHLIFQKSSRDRQGESLGYLACPKLNAFSITYLFRFREETFLVYEQTPKLKKISQSAWQVKTLKTSSKTTKWVSTLLHSENHFLPRLLMYLLTVRHQHDVGYFTSNNGVYGSSLWRTQRAEARCYKKNLMPKQIECQNSSNICYSTCKYCFAASLMCAWIDFKEILHDHYFSCT